jgi:negative regulator of sigma F NrsF-like protein
MHSHRLPAWTRLSWPPAVRAILWLDAVLLVAAALALAGKPPALGQADLWTWLALGGAALTAVLAALAAFHLGAPKHNPVWAQLPVPALVLWAAASGLGYLTMSAGAEVKGDTLGEARECLGFLLLTGLPLLALIVFMLWRAAAAAPRRVLTMGALASAGAAASLLMLVHPHASPALDLCAHGAAIAVLLGIAAAVAGLRTRASANAR